MPAAPPDPARAAVIARMLAAVDERHRRVLRSRWFGLQMPDDLGLPADFQYDVWRVAWLFPQLVEVNDRGRPDALLVEIACAIDAALVAVVRERRRRLRTWPAPRSPSRGRLEAAFMRAWQDAGLCGEGKAAWRALMSPAPEGPTSPTIDPVSWLTDRLRNVVRTSKLPALLEAMGNTMARLEPVASDSVTPAEELEALLLALDRIQSGPAPGADPRQAALAVWIEASPYLRRKIVEATRGKATGDTLGSVSAVVILEAGTRIAEALDGRPDTVSKRAAARTMRSAFSALSGARWSRDGHALARDLTRPYGIALSRSDLAEKPMDGLVDVWTR